MDVRIAICPASHLLRVVWPSNAGEFATARCPQCATEVRVRRVDGRMLSQESLTEAWRHRGG